MKSCPTCGASAGDADLFCEADGTKLVASAVQETAASAACPACGAANADAGDGYCSACGIKLEGAAPSAPAAPTITGGEPTAAEAKLREALERGPLHAMAPATLPANAKKLWDVGPEMAPEHALDRLDELLEFARAVERAGFSFAPSAQDFYVADDHLLLARLRGARALAPGEAAEAKTLMVAAGECLLPEPAVRATPRLVRALAPSKAASERRGVSLAELRAELAEVRREMAIEMAKGPIADLADAGLWRPYQQDATAIAEGLSADGEPWQVLVVCDGVSSSETAGKASSAAAKTTRDALAHFARSPDLRRESTGSAVERAIRAAHLITCATHVAEPTPNPPGTTIVCAFVHRRRVTIGWVGDSRAYFFTPRGGELLMKDHSWVNEAIARGEVKSEDEVQGSLAHTITKCLGPLEVGDKPEEIVPDVKSRDLPSPGVLVLCSDGLWNYASKPAEMHEVIKAAGPMSAAGLARFLVGYALARGGQDNVSVAVYTHAG